MAHVPLSLLARDLTLGTNGGTSTIPKLMYGTAWKEDKTDELVCAALRAGFRGIDTAGRSRHYREDLVAEGFRRACVDGIVQEQEIFVQSKVSPFNLSTRGDESLHLSMSECITDSLALRGSHSRNYLDAFLFHVPLTSVDETLRAWDALSEWTPRHIGHLGISNVKVDFFRDFYDRARVKPAIVQNRFCKQDRYDVALRKFCREKGVVYQSFWTITANRHLLRSLPVDNVAKWVGVSHVVACYALVLGLEGISILDGTSSEVHMREDLEGIDKVGLWREGVGNGAWEEALAGFKELIGEE